MNNVSKKRDTGNMGNSESKPAKSTDRKHENSQKGNDEADKDAQQSDSAGINGERGPECSEIYMSDGQQESREKSSKSIAKKSKTASDEEQNDQQCHDKRSRLPEENTARPAVLPKVSQVGNDELKKIKEQKRIISTLKKENKDLQRTLDEAIQSMFEVKASGTWNNSVDLMDPFRLSDNLQDIFTNEWDAAMSALSRLLSTCITEKDATKILPELLTIECLSELLKDCQNYCKDKSKAPFNAFLQSLWLETPRDNDDWHLSIFSQFGCTYVEEYNLLKLRQKLGLKDEVINRIVESYFKERPLNQTLRSLLPDCFKKDVKGFEKLTPYVKACLNSCWKIALCVETITLKFDVEGKPFKDAQEQYGYREYIMNKAYENCEKPDNEVILVVWPALYKRDRNGKDATLSTKNACVIVNKLSNEVHHADSVMC